MPKPKPSTPIHRMNIGVPLEVYEALQGYAEFLGKAPSTVASDLIKEMGPTMLAVAKAMQNAKKDQKRAIQEVRQIAARELSATQELLSNSDPERKEEQVELFNNKQEQPQ